MEHKITPEDSAKLREIYGLLTQATGILITIPADVSIPSTESRNVFQAIESLKLSLQIRTYS